MRPSMIIHGGAGSGRFGRSDARYAELGRALEAGMGAMKKGSSLDGVVAAVSWMEQSGLFNAGRGACLTADGRVELDAAVMEGSGLRGAGVGSVTSTYSAVSLARWVMENTRHVLLVGPHTRVAARAAGLRLERLKAGPRATERFAELRKSRSGKLSENLGLIAKMQDGNTVGAVGVDASGCPSAAVSTGGIWLKLPGRVGDSAVLGAGIYADCGSGAACATGMGEEIIRNVLSWQACELMKRFPAPVAARRAVAAIGRRSGPDTAGMVAVDRKGRVGFGFNTEAMGRAWYDHAKGRAVVQV